ncbi:MAG: hypothetical protein QG643_1658 [Pseudomonadota bacterium]|nr:hypothetical protein [Pseudomonadota bacterium]
MPILPPLAPNSPAASLANIVPNIARALLALTEDRGLDSERLCRGLGFTPQNLMRQDLLLSYQQTRSLILRAYQLLEDPAMGLAAGARQTPVSWGLPGLAMLTCETMGEAISYGLEHQDPAGAMVIHRFEANEREAFLELAPRLFDVQIGHYLIEESFASAYAIARWLIGPSFRPLRLELAYERPSHAEAYRQLFRCPVYFGMSQHQLVFEPKWLSSRLPGFDRVTSSLIREQLNTLLRKPLGRSDLVESLTGRLQGSISEAPRQADLARGINISERTLRRRLKVQETTYRNLRDDTRYQKSRGLLEHSELTVVEIAETVGYSDARAFRRAFKRWSGELPAAYRARLRALANAEDNL